MAQAQHQAYLTNNNTGETVLIKSNDYVTFQSKIKQKEEQWKKQNELRNKQENKETMIRKALEMTKQAAQEIQDYRNILRHTLSIDDRIDWNTLFDKTAFKEYQPLLKPEKQEYEKSVPKETALEIFEFVKKRRLKALEKAEKVYSEAVENWELKEKERLLEYEKEKKEYTLKIDAHNNDIQKKKEGYEGKTERGVAGYFELVLERSNYPASLTIFPSVFFEKSSSVLLVDMELPSADKFISTIEYKYVPGKNEIVGKGMNKKEFEEFYNDVIYKVALRTIHEICESDYVNAVETIVFNGWVDATDPKTGKQMRNCIASLQVMKKEYTEIALDRIQPIECFRHLKGVTAGSLVNLSPVKPIMVLNTDDKRIIQAVEVLGGFDENTNLAKMDWQDFEILIRDLIQKEFSHEGCKVEVTRASRDAGVDAIAFDEDPIRGGKYVIQAKRYNNLVPLSAVRDLYGTVHNEGAVKGILVTTSHYGGDALEFVKNKPLTLINGEQLIYMFNKHGYKMKIELTKKQRAASSVSY